MSPMEEVVLAERMGNPELFVRALHKWIYFHSSGELEVFFTTFAMWKYLSCNVVPGCSNYSYIVDVCGVRISYFVEEDLPFAEEEEVQPRRVLMSEELRNELRRLWKNYKIYADSCIATGGLPAPFGVTEEEKAIVEKVKAHHCSNR